MGKERKELESIPEKKHKTYEKWVFVLTILFFLGTSLYFVMENREKNLTGITISERILSVEAAVLGDSQEDETKDAPKLLEGETININTASSSDLQRLPNIGESRALAIIAYREESGGFFYKEELLLISGIGDGILADITDYITLE